MSRTASAICSSGSAAQSPVTRHDGRSGLARAGSVMMLGLLLSLTLPGCSTAPRQGDARGEANADIRAAMGEEAAPLTVAPPPPALLDPLKHLPGLSPAPGVGLLQPPAEERINISVENLPARDFFIGLVRGTRTNLVVHPEVEGNITLELTQVTVPEALELVRRAYGYDFERTGQGYVIYPRTLQTRGFNVNYLNLRREGRSSTSVASNRLNSSAGTGTTTPAASGSSAGADITTVSQADVWGELRQSLELLVCGQSSFNAAAAAAPAAPTSPASSDPVAALGALSAPQTGVPTAPMPAPMSAGSSGGTAMAGGCTAAGRSVVVTPQAGLVTVRALPGELREVERFLDSLRQNLNRQVLLEAKIVEITLNDSFQAGINWAGLDYFNSARDQGLLLGQTGGGTLLSNGQSDIAGQQANLNPDNRLLPTGADNGFGSVFDQTLTSAFGGLFTASLVLDDFTGFLELLKTQGEVQVLSSPRVATLNNQKAVIKVGRDQRRLYDFDINIVNDAGENTNADVERDPVFADYFSGIVLDVTPQIDADGMVSLHVHPVITDVNTQTTVITSGGVDEQYPLAAVDVRETDTLVRARSGQLVVIGGLMSSAESRDRASLPGVGDVPVAGELFGQRRNSSRKSELVILLKPVVIDSERRWEQLMNETRERVLRGP